MLEEFLSLLCGRFNNAAQAAEQQALDPNFPLAAHCNTACNDKIAHLPAGFAGVFVVEESTYTANGKTHASPHLFLFTEEGDGIRLTSYEIPAGYDKDTFTYAAMGRVHFLHARNIRFLDETKEGLFFHESPHPTSCGSLDLYGILRALYENGFDGYTRPDHGRNIWGEDGRPGYGLYDRALGAVYLSGVWEALEKSLPRKK